MAVFNPQLQPTQDPNFLNYSRVIEGPTPNLSGKIGLETASTGLDSAVTITDQSIKKGISDAAYAAVDPLRDQMTSGLEKIKGNLDQGVIPKPGQTVAGTTTGTSWLDSNAMAPDPEELPIGLEDSLGGVAAMAAAKAAGSPKLNDTKYAGEVLAEAKRLRSQYGPNYREYIDQKISEASGLPVANSYYNNMLLDINRQMAQMNRVKDDIGNTMMKNLDVPGMAGYITKRKAGDPAMTDAFVLGKVADWQNLQTQQRIDAAVRAEEGDKSKDDIKNQTQRMTRTLNSSVTMEMSALKDASLPGGGTGKDLMQWFDEAANRPEVTETEFGQKKLMFNNWVQQVERRLLAQSTGYASTVGYDAAEKGVKAAMAPIYAQQKFINSKEDGPAFFHAQQIEAISKDAAFNFLNNKDTSAVSRQLIGARTILGEQYFPDWIRSIITNGVDKPLKDMFNEEAMSAIQPYTDTRGQPIPRFMVDAMKHGKAVGADGDSNYYGSITGLVEHIANPKMPLASKDQLIDWAFNKKNVGRLDELKMDYRDPQTGSWVDGKYRAFNIMSAPAITQAVKETALVHPDNYKKYQSTLETEFGRLYRSTLQDLNKAVGDNTLGLHFSFNDKTNQFGLVDKNDRPIQDDPHFKYGQRNPTQYPQATYIAGIQDKLTLVNSGLANLANVQRNNPTGGETDTSKYLLQALQTAGFRPGSNITGATEGMARAIIMSRNPQMTPDELNKSLLGTRGPAARSNFAPEDDNSLAAFLRSPAGRAQGPPSKGVIKGNLSDEQLVGMKTYDIPDGMSAREFINQLKAGKKFGGGVD